MADDEEIIFTEEELATKAEEERIANFDYSQPNKIVNGVPYLMTEAEIVARQQEEAEYETKRPQKEALANIHKLESEITIRRLIESIADLQERLDVEDAFIVAQNEKIKTERAKLPDKSIIEGEITNV